MKSRLSRLLQAIDRGDVGLMVLALGAGRWDPALFFVVIGLALLLQQRPLKKWWED